MWRARSRQASKALGIAHPASPATSKRLTVSIGIACINPTSDRSHYGFIQLADEALYAAKERGRNCIVIMDKEYGDLSTGSFRKGPEGRGRRRRLIDRLGPHRLQRYFHRQVLLASALAGSRSAAMIPRIS